MSEEEPICDICERGMHDSPWILDPELEVDWNGETGNHALCEKNHEFAPDSLSSEPDICTTCFYSVEDHETAFAYGWHAGYYEVPEGIKPSSNAEFNRGIKQGIIDRERVNERTLSS